VGAILRTPRLLLRPLELGDADALWPLVSDPALPRLMSWDAHTDRAQTRAWLTDAIAGNEAGTDLVWAIVPQLGADGPPAVASGTIGLHGVRHQFRAWRIDRAELGYWIAPALHGRGLMTEAAREVLRFAFAAPDDPAGGLGLHKITVGCLVENDASRRVIEKLGFRFLCEHREHLFRFDRWWNQLSWEMTAAEYRG
jgi:RimJ/RimL family protein N-acetyltransferase